MIGKLGSRNMGWSIDCGIVIGYSCKVLGAVRLQPKMRLSEAANPVTRERVVVKLEGNL